VCRRLEGIPLAIELAAARTRALSVGQISERLDDIFGLLVGGRTAPDRQRTLRATMDWSHELLSGQERLVFRRLSVFAGGFALEAAEDISAGGSVEGIGVLETLSRLVDKSLVVVTERGGEARYRLSRSSASTPRKSSKPRPRRRPLGGATPTTFWAWPRRPSRS
jgi:predicted ATPase